MIFVKKLPTLEPEMRGALRSHIIRKRQRLKQELEQDAIEKRLKREKELRQIQDAMTLDQIKEQLSVLEKRLETLRDEKHSLFVQLKQVLNEDNTRRKQQHESDNQKQQTANTSTSSTVTSEPQASSTPTVLSSIPLAVPLVKATSSKFDQTMINQHRLFAPTNDRYMEPSSLARQQNFRLVPPGMQVLPRVAHQIHSGPANPINETPSLPLIQNYSTSFSRHPSTTNMPMNLDLRSSFRTHLSAGSIGHEPMSTPPNPMAFTRHRLHHPHLESRPLLMDIPLSLTTNQHQDLKDFTTNNKRSLVVAGLNDAQLEDPMARKKPNSFTYTNLDQFSMNSVPQDISNSLNNANNLQAPHHIGAPVPSSVSNPIHNNFQSMRPPVATNFDFLMNSAKSELLVPGINSLYPSHSTRMPPSQLYSNLNNDLKHLTPLYHNSLTQQYGNTSRHGGFQVPQPEYNPHYLKPSNGLPYHRKQTHSKNPYQQNK